MKLHEKILYCRKKAGLSQEALAEKVGVSRQAVSKWETGDTVPEITKLSALARAFGVTVDWMISEDPPSGFAHGENGNNSDSTNEKERVESESAEERASAYLNASAGFIGRTAKRYGWVFGVYIAVVGGIFTLFGTLIKILSSIFFTSTVTQEVTSNTINVDGVVLENPFFSTNPFFPDFVQDTPIFNPVSIIGNVVIGIGIILLVFGIILAIILKKKSR